MDIMRLKYFLTVLVVLSFIASASFSGEAFAQSDDTIKPLPDFLSEQPASSDFPQNASSAPVPSAPAPVPKDNVRPAYEVPPMAPEVSDADAPKGQIRDLSAIPDHYIREATAFGEKCRNHHERPLYYDCRCLGVEYLDARIRLGASASASAIENQLGAKCKDGSGIAGQHYQRCLNDFVNAPKHLDPEEYCRCYGNSYAKYFERLQGKLTVKGNISLMSRAKLTCSNPKAAQRIYGNIP